MDTLILLETDYAGVEDSDILVHLPGMFLAAVGELDIPAHRIGTRPEAAR